MQLALEVCPHVLHLVQQPHDHFHAREIHPKVLRKPLDLPNSSNIRLAVHTVLVVHPRRHNQALAFVSSKRLRVNPAKPSRNTDGVNRVAVVHFRSLRISSNSRFSSPETLFGMAIFKRTSKLPL